MIGILEDADARRFGFRQALAAVDPRIEVVFHDNAPDFVAWLRSSMGLVRLVSLDGDLFLCDTQPDPGTGLDVVQFLTSSAPSFPVIVHSANPTRGEAMMAALAGAGWDACRADPLQLDWMTRQWLPAVKRALSL